MSLAAAKASCNAAAAFVASGDYDSARSSLEQALILLVVVPNSMSGAERMDWDSQLRAAQTMLGYVNQRVNGGKLVSTYIEYVNPEPIEDDVAE